MGTMTIAIHVVEIAIIVAVIMTALYIIKLAIEFGTYNGLMDHYGLSPEEASEKSHIKIKIRR